MVERVFLHPDKRYLLQWETVHMKLAQRMGRLGTETAFEVFAKAKRMEAEGKDIIHLEIGEPDFDTPDNIIDAGKRALSDGHTHYGPSAGLTEVRERIAEEVSLTRGISVSGDHIVVTPGAKPIMFFTMLAVVDEGDEVLCPNPGFPIYESMVDFVGGVAVPMKLLASRDFRIDVDEVAGQVSSKTKLMILNSPNNPCGSIIEKDEMLALADLARENDLLVLSDEIYRRFLYEGGAPQYCQFFRHAGQDDTSGRVFQDLRHDGLADRIRRHAVGAGGAYFQARYQQCLLHGSIHADCQHRSSGWSARRGS